ncbi:MAG: AMP-binding protein [Gammaproteobacteria bacterium]|nr:AMP-binding protein [Gammaproteobacteria bacterium]
MLALPKNQWTIVNAVKAQAQQYGERVFCTFADGSELTFAGFDRESDALASGLANLGVESQDRVMMLGYNSKAFLITWLAVMKRGAIFVPINTELKGAFLQHQFQNCAPKVIFVDGELRHALSTIDTSTIDTSTIDTNGADTAGVEVEYTVLTNPGAAPITPLARSELRHYADLAATAGQADQAVTPVPADICTIMYTSGTTGPSKGVLMPQGHCFLFGHNAARCFAVTADDVMYICMPLFHAMGLPIQLIGSLIAGASVHVVRRFSATRWLDDIRACGATITFGLGVIPEFIFRQPATPHDRDHQLRKMVAVPIANEWGAAFEERFGLKLLQGYGMTECNIPSWYSLTDPLVPGRAGPVIDEHFEVRIVDSQTDELLPIGEVGEIVIRPKQPSCFMAGYFRMPERTVEAWRNLWFHSGDAGRIDEHGRLYFVDRIKDCIRRRGENISSFEIEQVLNDHEHVSESAAIGVRVEDAGGEEEVKACIVPIGNHRDPVVLLDWCAERMPRYAVPRYIEFVSALAKTPTGKLQKQGFKDAGVTNDTWDREAAGYVIARD